MLSMTGHGRAVLQEKGLDLEVEIRSVNHRFFTLKQSLPEGWARFESEAEKFVRGRIARGSVTLLVSLKRAGGETVALPTEERVRGLYEGLTKLQKKLRIPGTVTMEALISLPQLWNHAGFSAVPPELWPKVEKLLEKALDDHARMREREGKGIRKDMLARISAVEERATEIQKRVPAVQEAYQKKLQQRLDTLVSEHGLQGSKPDVVKELALYADRSDISEEVQRLQSHVRQFRGIVDETGPVGRKIDFLTQEMVRETNTLSAKSGDSTISRLAVEIKSELEKIKEQGENVE